MRWTPREARFGDMIRVGLGSILHYGIFVSPDEVIQFGLPPLPENRASEGKITVRATDLAVFACGRTYEVAVPGLLERLRGHSRRGTVRRARASLGETGYDLLHNNCEHFAYRCAYGVSLSTQEQAVRRKWLQRPILDVYVAALTDPLPQGGDPPPAWEKYIRAGRTEDQREARRFAWRMLAAGAEHSFACPPADLRLKKTADGWQSGQLFFSVSLVGELAALAVSNAPAEVAIDDAGAVVLDRPPLQLRVEGRNRGQARYFSLAGSTPQLIFPRDGDKGGGPG